ncbi:serine hydrolase [Candidatus Azambacteria bacterium]|nr:serine hydrolase [Candidatus Azambacteria bacterium]
MRQNGVKNSNKRNFYAMAISAAVVLASLALSIFSFFFYIPSKEARLYEDIIKKYPLIDPAQGLYKKEDLIVDFQPLRNDLEKIGARRSLSIYFEYLPTGANINVNKDLAIWPASLIKVPIAMAAMKKVENGTWKLSNELVILDVDKDKDYGTLFKKPSGTTITIEDLLKESLINSDNTAHFVLLRNLENSEIEDLYDHLGLEDVLEALKKSPSANSSDNRITAKRYSIFFRSLYKSTYLSPEYSEKFLDLLSQNTDNRYLAGVMPMKDISMKVYKYVSEYK